MNQYLAKSHPKETIQEHTDELLANLQLLQSIYPNLNVDWDMLETACIYHDLGKMNRKFQDKIEGIKRHDDEIPHNYLSIAFLDYKKLKERYTVNQIQLIAKAIAYHHNRGTIDAVNYQEEVEKLNQEIEGFIYEKVELTQAKKLPKKYFNDKKPWLDDEDYYEYLMMKGIINRLDYAASAHIQVEVENDFLTDALETLGYKWNELQQFMKSHQEENIIAIAQTGMGKTEAGLWWIGNNKGFFTLPIKTAINAMYERITEGILKGKYENIGLLHSDIFSRYMKVQENHEELDVENYMNKTKQLSLPLTVCTLDQIFDIVFRYTDMEAKLATLTYSKIVIDEIQMYSPDLLAYLIIGLSYIQRFGGKFAILTATLPSLIPHFLEKEKVTYVQPEKAYINDMKRHKIKVIEEQLSAEEILKVKREAKTLIICNTVKKAQQVFEKLKEEIEKREENIRIQLFHSKFTHGDRKQKEEEILRLGDKDTKETGIWVTTQVVEASLDIDFDILFTELSDVNGLFQRMGRCYRKRERQKEEPNCYVYVGDHRDCSGVGAFIDKDIYRFSKTEIMKYSGIITEEMKLKIIEEVYAVERISSTAYYQQVEEYIKRTKNFNDYEYSKNEVKKDFRNIETITIIPRPLYEEKTEEIEKIIEEYKQSFESEPDKKKRAVRKGKLLDQLKQYTASIQVSEIEGAKWKKGNNCIKRELSISDYHHIGILECKYSYEMGISEIGEEFAKDYENREL